MAPRKPERFAEAEALARAEGLRVVRRTELPVDAEPRADVVILDTIGELAQLFQVATVVFVGGSLVDQGGHNILEPAVHGKPIVFGPHMQNFAEIADDVPAQPGGDAGGQRRGTGDVVGPAGRAIRSSARASAPRRARWSRPIAAPSRARWTSSRPCCRRRAAAGRSVRSGGPDPLIALNHDVPKATK